VVIGRECVKMQLRYYQKEAIDSIFNYFETDNGNPLIALPTGTGKSHVIAGFIQKVLFQCPGQRFMMLTHVKELIEQNYEKLLLHWPTAPVGIYSSGLKRKDFHHPIVFGGVASVKNKVSSFGHRDILMIDEAHLLSPKDGSMYQKVIAALKETNPYLKVIGLTATPYRLGQGLLTDDGVFTDICYNKTNLQGFNELIKEGFLCKLVPRPTEIELDVSDVKLDNRGDFKQNELQAAVDKNDITARALKELILWGENRKSWLIFASGIEHAQHITDMLNDYNIPSACVHSKLKDGRDEIIRDFKLGKLRCVVNNNVLTTGFDHPEIDLIGMLRPTVSPGLWVQMLGRGARIAMDKDNCLVLDFAGNTKRLGPVNDPIIPQKKGKRAGTAPIKVCPECGVLNHASVRHCDFCGYEFPRYSKITTQASEAELIRESKDIPKTKWGTVDSVFFTRHTKPGRPDSIKVTYQCGLRMFTEYISPHWKGNKFKTWWKERSVAPIPNNVDEFFALTEYLKKPKEIRIWLNSKHQDILNYKF